MGDDGRDGRSWFRDNRGTHRGDGKERDPRMSETDSPRAAAVVGGRRGIGFEAAAALARAGAGVVVNGRDRAAVEEAVARLTSAGHRAVGVAGSAAEDAVAERVVRTCAYTFGAVDALVNCAGTPAPDGSSILNVSTEQWHSLLDAHLTTAFATCRAVAPIMV